MLQDILVAFVTDRAEKGGHGQLLLPVDVRVHDVVDVRGKFNPATLEWDDSRGVQLRAVRVEALAKEDTGRTVKLGNDHTLGSIHNECAAWSHVRDGSQVHILDDGLKVLVFGVRTVKFKTCLERYAVGQPALDAFHLAVTGGVYKIIDEFQYKLVAGIRNGEVFIEGLKQAFI